MPATEILTVVGARPQFVKAAVVSRAIAKHNELCFDSPITEKILHTGQHYDSEMSQVFFEEMEIPDPYTNLAIGSGDPGERTGRMLAGIEAEIMQHRPDWVLVYGDTDSTLAGALAAAKLHVPVAHVEAGMRSFNKRMPEEINRVLTDHISECLFCPSQQSKRQLAAEGITGNVHVVGDVMYDAVLFCKQKAIPPDCDGEFALATIHRAENTDDTERLREILEALGKSPVPIVLPLHPRTQKIINQDGFSTGSQVKIVSPLSYFAMLGHLDRCAFVVTDSGGLQKEAYFFGKKCITLRDETEWVELVQCDANRIVGASSSAIRDAFVWAEKPLKTSSSIYGDGDAGGKIVNLLAEWQA